MTSVKRIRRSGERQRRRARRWPLRAVVGAAIVAATLTVLHAAPAGAAVHVAAKNKPSSDLPWVIGLVVVVVVLVLALYLRVRRSK